jgi:hypothetical protein
MGPEMGANLPDQGKMLNSLAGIFGCLRVVRPLNSKVMAEIEDFPLAMAEGEVIEPMMQVPSRYLCR